MKKYSLEMLEGIYRHQEPGLSASQIREKAKTLYRQLYILDICWARSN